ncbi:polysaccharide biosynthesis protein [Flavobacteriaceae bacterium SZ-1-7]|uniref:polysaccharide biosynthesis protein n=1 Tax=Tamlana sedimenti TaxID=3134126 RepID=UPI003122A524
MNKILANHIDRLLIDSGLFPTNQKPTEYSSNFNFAEETILITGAAGSIGSGLCKQLLTCKFKKLILVDMAESPLYELIKELEFENLERVEFLLLNIIEEESVRHIFSKYKPSLIFHAAAYKHVPLMEENPYEAVKNNVFATKLLADLSIEHSVKKFIFISTDKAVNPVSVMGTTKLIGEKYLSSLNSKHKTAFFNARFGNILGSNGSVIPLFKKQLENDMPITLTDRRMSRYFICKRKACNLILKIALLNEKVHNTFTFNMGEPIRMVDMVERIIHMCNKQTQDIEIRYTGLRPGEKLDEDIISENEILIPTKIKDILAVKEKMGSEPKPIDLSELYRVTPYMPNTEITCVLKSYI